MSPHILIIEDETAIAETLIYACSEANMQTTHCLLGQTGLAELQKSKFDFVVLDVGLPDITGFEVCKQIRAFSNVPVLFLTARNHEIDRIVGLEIGADDYLAKPFSPREVVTRIHTILRRTQAPATISATSKQQAFRHDKMACRIYFHETALSLTRYEYLLLKTLLEQPKRVFSRAQLMDIVWENADDTLERTVDTHIKTVRAKLRHIKPDVETIITHRGMGYSLLV